MTLQLSELYRSKTGAYHTYRIPALVTTPRGTVLAFCEGRRGGSADDVPIDLLLRRSSDGGRTWDEPTDISTGARQPTWSYVGSGPGHGIQLHSGRLLIPAWADESPGPVTWRAPGANWGKVPTSYAFYSDDAGHSWQVGDRVYMSLRSRHDRHRRGYAWSGNGGHSWQHSRVIYPGAAAYSDLAVSAEGDILCLFEADDYASLQLAHFAPAWLG